METAVSPNLMLHLNVMKPLVIPLTNEKALSVPLVGGKAAALARLIQAGYPVPNGICVTTAVFQQALQPFQTIIQTRLTQDNVADSAERITTRLNNLALPEVVSVELENELAAWLAEGKTVAVRSSATAEDRADVSFAGQYESYLGLRDFEAVEAAILNCWRSFFTTNALASRADAGGFILDDGMAVLIQPMIASECAGVCFSLDPVAQKRGHMVVNSVWGLGPGVVDGTVPTDTDWVTWDRAGFHVLQRQTVAKQEQVDVDEKGALCLKPVPKLWQRTACLPEKWLLRLAQFAVSLDSFFGCPQDIEWAVANGRLWILQSRPITALSPEYAQSAPFPVNWQSQAEAQRLWRLMLYSRSAKPPLPLEHDYIAILESVRDETCLFLGVDANQAVEIINGRGYACAIPLNLTAADKQVRQAAQEDLKARLQKQGITSWEYWGPELVQAVNRLRQFDINKTNGAALAAHVGQTVAVLRRACAIHPRLWFKPLPSYFAAFTAVTGITGSDAESLAYQLLDNEETHLTRLVDGLYDLAEMVRQETAVSALIKQPTNTVMADLAALPEAADFLARLDLFLQTYGERLGEGYGSEMTVCTPTWGEDPARVLQLVASYLDSKMEPPALSRDRARKQRDTQVDAYCQACADETAVSEFRHQLAYARKNMTVLEEHNHTIEQACGGQLRMAIMAAAKWLVAQKIMTNPDDIFWLTFVEIEEALRNPSQTGITAVIKQRQQQYAVWAALSPPPIVGIPDAGLGERPPAADDITSVNTNHDEVRGIGASSGQVQGRACLMLDPFTLPSDLAFGDILVAPNIGPIWTPIFPMLGGLVLDSGSMGQHAAATAREYGVTAVVATGNATQLIPDGVLLLVDGENGRVQILQT
ncbi:MAG: hypothetical protein IAF02_01350 [Anaerolineae bacterium]|nr:hypothetical protein [Anaerolineae bacterium]